MKLYAQSFKSSFIKSESHIYKIQQNFIFCWSSVSVVFECCEYCFDMLISISV